MATFTSFNNRLPDPTFLVNDAGAVGVTGAKGPGFASTRVISNEDTTVSRTNSGRGVPRSGATQYWEISITYNPMLRDEFDVVDTFLHSRRGRRKAFFVVLPQYSRPKDPAFVTFATDKILKAANATSEGSPTLNIVTEDESTFTSYPRPGDFFTISDPTDINHLKAYKVIAVETNDLYQEDTIQPPVNQVRVHINPPLTKFVTGNAVINFIDPQFRVIQKGDVIEHELNTDNLYQFGLQLEEIMP